MDKELYPGHTAAALANLNKPQPDDDALLLEFKRLADEATAAVVRVIQFQNDHQDLLVRHKILPQTQETLWRGN